MNCGPVIEDHSCSRVDQNVLRHHSVTLCDQMMSEDRLVDGIISVPTRVDDHKARLIGLNQKLLPQITCSKLQSLLRTDLRSDLQFFGHGVKISVDGERSTIRFQVNLDISGQHFHSTVNLLESVMDLSHVALFCAQQLELNLRVANSKFSTV